MTGSKKQWTRWIAAALAIVAWSVPAAAEQAADPADQVPAAVEAQPQAPAAPRTVGPRAGGRGQAAAPQAPRAGGSGDAPVEDVDAPPDDDFTSARPVLRVGQDHVVPEGTAVREVVIVGGELTIHGRVRGDAVIIAGVARLGPEARVDGDLVAIGSPLSIAAGARVDGDVVAVGGALDAAPGFAPGGDQVVVGTAAVGGAVQRAVPWVTYGLLLGRPIVPSLPWMWVLIAVVFFVYLVLGFLLERPVRASAEALVSKPLSTFLVGLLVWLLTGPVLFILAVSVVGLIVIPFAVCALFVASLLGRIAVSRAIGGTVIPEETPGDRLAAARSFAIGFAVMILAYMIPFLGFVTYMLVGVFGIGAATMALVAGLRRENPAKPRPPQPMSPAGPGVEMYGGVVSGAASDDGGRATAFADAPAAPAFDHASPPMAYAAGGAVPVSALAAELVAMPKASFLERAGAFFIDVLAVAIFMSVFGDMESPRPFFLLLLVYHVVFWTLKATTIGGILFNLRVIKTDGTPVGFGDATIRGLSAILSLVVLFLGAIWILFDPDRQAWHDRFAGTFVVKVPRHWRG
jgi:uncharacterized RDD family membrane protein YckC